VSRERSQDIWVPHRYTVPWIALGAVRSLEAHVPGAVITQYSTEDQLWRISTLELVPAQR
jgi:hypothetical protein